MKMLRFLALSLALAIPLGGAVACGGDDSNVDYPPFPPPTDAPDGSPQQPDPDGEPQGPADPIINEFVRSDDQAPDEGEFIEILGDPDTDYSAYTVIAIEGDIADPGIVDHVLAVGTTDSNGYYVIPQPTTPLENSSQTLLLVENFTGAEDDDLDDSGGAADIGDGTLDTTPWDEIVDAVAIDDGGPQDVWYVMVDGTTYGPVLPLSGADGGAARIPDGTDTDGGSDWLLIPESLTAGGAGEANATPGAANTEGS